MSRIFRRQYAYIEDSGQVVLIAQQSYIPTKLAERIKCPDTGLSDFEATISIKLQAVTDTEHLKRLQKLLRSVQRWNALVNTDFERLKYAPTLPTQHDDRRPE